MRHPAGAARAGERGQALVLVALFLTSLLGMAAVAVDVGRFYTVRRFLQNSADSAALAAANALILGHTQAEAEAEARALLARNFLDDPTGTPPALPSAVPLYADGHAGEGQYLVEGILFSGGEVRVALRNPVGYTFGRVVGLTQQEIGARARVGFTGGLMPIAVRRYVNMPGPHPAPGSPCANDQTQFLDFFATQNTACLGTDSDPTGRTAPSTGANFDPVNPDSDPANHGPVVTILGQGAQPANGASFRGFINLDIRNFETTTSQQYFNGVTPGMNPNTLKQKEAGWVSRRDGYPPPYPPTPTTPPDPNDQVGIIEGNSTGIAIDEVTRRFGPGDEILVTVYPGSVMAIPDFSLSPPATVALPPSGLTANAGSLKVSRNQSFSGQVTMSTLADTLDPANPMVQSPPTLTGATPITYDPNPVTPSLGNGSSVALANVTTSGATPGIYALWVQGQAGSPYLTTKQEPFAVKIGDVTKDFAFTSDASSKDATNIGDTVSFTLTLQNSPNKNTPFGGPVTLSVDTPLPAGAGPVTFGTNPVTPSKLGDSTTLSINTGTMAQGSYRFVVRATGMNGDSLKVTHLLPLTVAVAPAGSSGSDQYVDIVGFALMRITSVTANNVDAYAITPVITDLNDQALRRGQTARLLPWD